MGKFDAAHLKAALWSTDSAQEFNQFVNQLEMQLEVRNTALTPHEWQIHLFEQVDSTNTILWKLADQGATEGTVAIALQQTAGRGQWGRPWESALGGLYLSLLLTPKLDSEQGNQLTLCSAWGIATTLQRQAVPIRLKWPNDLMIGSKKLGGILTETRSRQGQIQQAVIGVGINWSNPTPAIGINLQTVLAAEPQIQILSLENLAAIALNGLWLGYHVWQQYGIATVLSSYEALLINPEDF